MEVSSISYELPDGKIIDIGAERYTLPEEFFKSNSNHSIIKLVHESIQKCDTDLKKDVFSNTVLSGCNTLIKGMKNF
jgi:actin-related protein